MSFDLVKMLEAVAPTLAGMLGGPLAGTAVTALEGAFGLPAGAGPEAITEVAQAGGMTPEILASIRAADQKNQEILAQQQVDLTKLNLAHAEVLEETAAADRASARTREVSVRDKTPEVLTYMYTIALFAVIAVEIWVGVTGRVIDPMAMKTLDTLFGVLMTMVIGAKEYYLGTSSGDAHKTELLAGQQK